MSARGTQCTSREPLFTSEPEWGAYMHFREASPSANDLQLHGAALRKLREVRHVRQMIFSSTLISPPSPRFAEVAGGEK
jgi:hypothetical protein